MEVKRGSDDGSPGRKPPPSSVGHRPQPPAVRSGGSIGGGVPEPPSSATVRFFKKCKSATFQIDGATYTIADRFSRQRGPMEPWSFLAHIDKRITKTASIFNLPPKLPLDYILPTHLGVPIFSS
ncbi:hypothetical protein DMENIID0001_037340 [Sergentomyia squamirostris]